MSWRKGRLADVRTAPEIYTKMTTHHVRGADEPHEEDILARIGIVLFKSNGEFMKANTVCIVLF